MVHGIVHQEKNYLKKVFDHLLKDSKNESTRYKNIKEVVNTDIGFGMGIVGFGEWIVNKIPTV